MDERDEVFETRRVLAELRHADLLEKRNASYFLASAVTFGFLTISYELQYLQISNLFYLMVVAILIFFVFQVLLIIPINRELISERHKLYDIISELGTPFAREVVPQVRYSQRLYKASIGALILGFLFRSNSPLLFVGFALLVVALIADTTERK